MVSTSHALMVCPYKVSMSGYGHGSAGNKSSPIRCWMPISISLSTRTQPFGVQLHKHSRTLNRWEEPPSLLLHLLIRLLLNIVVSWDGIGLSLAVVWLSSFRNLARANT